MNKNLITQLLQAMVWVSETTQCAVISHRTSVACTFINSLKNNIYDRFRLARRLVRD